MDEKKRAGIIRKVEQVYLMWKDKSTTGKQKTNYEDIIKKTCTEYGLDFDWTTGKVKNGSASSKNAKSDSAKQEQAKQRADKAKKEAEDKAKKEAEQAKQTGRFSTKDLIKLIFDMTGQEWTGKNLRRKLRQMDRWNDGVTTHYNFTKEQIEEVLQHLGIKKTS